MTYGGKSAVPLVADPQRTREVAKAPLTDDERLELLELLEARERAKARRAIERYYPETGPLRRELYVPHMAFFKAGLARRERLFLAANRVGKSEGVGGFETSLHLTGQYPSWWEGRRFDHGIAAWCAGSTVRDTRDTLQKIMLGAPGQLGTGMIPGDSIIKTTARAGVVDAIDTVMVRHRSGSVSTLSFRSYEAGREAFQAVTLDLVWCDEEPSLEIYTEALLRTMTTNGCILCTFTPLSGMSGTVMHFLPDGRAVADAESGPFVVTATWDDAPHLTAEAKAELWESIPPHLRAARTRGVPQLGSGAIFPLGEEEFVVEPMAIPPHWAKAYALDVGWNKTACLWGALDRETDTLVLYDELYSGQSEPPVHAAAIRARGKWIRGVIDPASRGRQQADGQQLYVKYLDLGLLLSPANNAVEAGLFEVWSRLSTGRLKVFSSLRNWLAEYRLYRRDDHGKVVKERDHLMDCMRYLVMSGLHVAGLEPGYAQRFAYGGEPWRGGRGERGGVVHEYDPFSAARISGGHDPFLEMNGQPAPVPTGRPGAPGDELVARVQAAPAYPKRGAWEWQ
jgi:phage terminase large subunit-like protein